MPTSLTKFGRTDKAARRWTARRRAVPQAAEVLEDRLLLTATLTLDDGDAFGASIANVGDLDGDGVTEIAVAANWDDDGGGDQGAVYIQFMNSDGTVRSRQKLSGGSGGVANIPADSRWFGESLAGLGDLNGDGFKELAVGMRGDSSGGIGRGAVYILSLNADGTVRSQQKISSTDGWPNSPLRDTDNFGCSLAMLGDLNGDGITELAVGAFSDDDGGTSHGAAYILFLNADGTVQAHQKVSDLEGGFTATLGDQAQFGWAVAGLGDLDGDGTRDLAVAGRGAVYVLFLNSNGTVRTHQSISGTEGGFAGPLDPVGFASDLAGLGDFDGDGVADLAVGASGAVSGGAASLLLLNADGTVKSQRSIAGSPGGTISLHQGESFGSSLTGLDDFDGDGVIDLAVGASGCDDGGDNRGAAFVLLLNADGTVRAASKSSDTSPPPFALSDTFLLQSLPGARHTIYLDFNGHTTTGTNWNAAYTNGAAIVTPAYDRDGDPTTFDDAELAQIQRIWQRVSEDYAPFEVNVTTRDPGTAALINSGGGDTQWGIRVVIGGNSTEWYGAGPGIGGVAYYNSFNWSNDTPAFVFTENPLGTGGEKGPAECVSHEVGHSLGLHHDGKLTSEYYTGHGSGPTGWNTIMGAATNHVVTQWSRGEYPDANNTEDDLNLITTLNGFGYRADDHGGSAATATPLTATSTTIAGAGLIERNTDLDWFSFVTGAGHVSIDVSPFVRGPNLDILARLYDAAGTLIASSNPLSTLDAAFDLTLAAGRYYLSIDGTGKPANGTDYGYSDYGSLGRYTITGTVVEPPPNAAPVAEAGGPYTVVRFASVTVSAAGSADPDGSIVKYEWDLDGDGQFDDAVGVTASFPGSVVGTFVLAVRVTDDRGGTAVDTATVTVTTPPTKFFVVDDGTADRTYGYASGGQSLANAALAAGNAAPRGAASTAAGDKVWVIDANKTVYVYSASGTFLGSWTATGLSTPEDIATNGTDVWIVDAGSDKVFRYAGAAIRLSASQAAASSFALNAQNKGSKGLEVAGSKLWVVDDATKTDKVFVYNLSGGLLGSWTIDAANKTPTDLTLDPTNPTDVWIVDAGTDRVYRYANAASRLSGSQNAADSFALAAGNTNPQGIADPPTAGGATSASENTASASVIATASASDASDSRASVIAFTRKVESLSLLVTTTKKAAVPQAPASDIFAPVTRQNDELFSSVGNSLPSLLDALLAG